MLDWLMVLAKDLIQTQIDSDTFMRLILDSSKVVDVSGLGGYESQLRALERQSISLCHSLHTERFKRLEIIPKRKR